MAAEPFHPLFLDDPQQLALRLDWELCDGIEVHRPRFRQFEAARPRGEGVRERAALVAEQLRIDERR